MEVGKHRKCLQGPNFGMELKKMTKLMLMLPFIIQGKLSDLKALKFVSLGNLLNVATLALSFGS